MGSEAEDNKPSSVPKLSLFSLPTKVPEPADMLTPPRKTSASVPFLWEEAPGKPRACAAESKPKSTERSLELPPRLLLYDSKSSSMSLSSPTTVLDGPYLGRSVSYRLSLRSPEEGMGLGKREVAKEKAGHFGSMRWGGFKKNKDAFEGSFDLSSSIFGGGGGEKEKAGHFGSMRWGTLKKNKDVVEGSFDLPSSIFGGDGGGGGGEKQRAGHLGSMRWGSFKKNKDVVEGSFDFSSSIFGGHDGGGGGGGETKVKIARVRRKGSLLSLSHTRSHFLASIYESVKQVVPWRRRQEKIRKMASF